MVLLSLSVGIIVIGVWFSGSNAYKFMKGYLLFKTGDTNTVMSSEAPNGLKDKKPRKAELYPDRPKLGEMMGNLSIPTIDANLPIYHGTDEDELEKGVGHFAGSVLPGERDNSVLSGHRDTVFRKLGDVGRGDLLQVTTEAGTFTYKVRKVRIVDADDRTVIVPKPRPTLTVSTCYPFDYIGDAPERYILVADLIESKK
ncbi:class D sortase [Mesobacillus jeotgali]|uniref:class D sortase n=1 Tax=Mesobacillus jeotgali TaxID=129985 RepID=UPI0035A34749